MVSEIDMRMVMENSSKDFFSCGFAVLKDPGHRILRPTRSGYVQWGLPKCMIDVRVAMRGRVNARVKW